MSAILQPKSLYELAFGSFITYMENEAQQLKLERSPEGVTVKSRVCSKLKRFFHGTRLPPSMANQLTKHLLIKLDSMYYIFHSVLDTECYQLMLLSLVEVFMHPDVTGIELGQSYFHGFDSSSCNFISWMILAKVRNLQKLKVLNLPNESDKKGTLVFPSQLKELTVGLHFPTEDILRGIVESCPKLKSLTMRVCSDKFIPLILCCKHLKTLRLTNILERYDLKDKGSLTLINGLSTDATSDVLSGTTLKSFRLKVGDQNTLSLTVDKLPNLTEIIVVCYSNIDLSSLTQLKNLRSLSLEEFSSEKTTQYKKVLPVLGKNLVFLEIKWYILDLEFIAENCTHLKCLHFSIRQCTEVNSSLKTFQNFKTVECLIVRFEKAESDMAAFLIAQCTNIKTLTVNVNYTRNPWGNSNSLYRTIEDVLRRTPALNWMVIEHASNDEFVESLLSRHPNFRVVKTHSWTRLSSQVEVFDTLGCYYDMSRHCIKYRKSKYNPTFSRLLSL